MKTIISLLFALIGCLGISAQTANDGLVRAATIVDGLFFDKSATPAYLIPANSTTTILKDPDGQMVLGKRSFPL